MDYTVIMLSQPSAIDAFLRSVFEIYEIRGCVGQVNGVEFIVHTKEKCHSTPHVHARYGECEVSIAIDTGEILDGNLPKKNLKLALNWVRENKDKLLNDWKDIAISATSSLTASALSLK